MTLTPGLICVCAADQGRYTAFYEHLLQLQRPEGSQVMILRSASIARSRNVACEALLADPALQWLMFIDDDQTFAPDMLMRLLSREKPIITGTYLIRKWPFNVCAFWKWDGDGATPQGIPVVLRPGVTGTHPIVAAGAGCLLIQRSVLETIPKPWFDLTYSEPDMLAEDFSFFRRVHTTGVTPWIDLDTIVGHMVSQAIWPYREGSDWLTVIASGGERIPIPCARDLVRLRREEDAEFADPRVIIP